MPLFLTASFAAYTSPAASFLSSVESGSASRRLLEEKSHKPISQHLRTRNRKLASILNPVICRQDCKLRMSSPTRYFNHSILADQTAKELLQPLLAAQVLP